MRTKKLKNANASTLVWAIVCLMPFIALLLNVVCSAIAVGQNSATIDVGQILISSLDFSKVDILNLNEFNSWLLANVIKIEDTASDLIKNVVTFSLFSVEWLVFVECAKVAVNFLLILPRACSRAFGGFGDYE